MRRRLSRAIPVALDVDWTVCITGMQRGDAVKTRLSYRDLRLFLAIASTLAVSGASVPAHGPRTPAASSTGDSGEARRESQGLDVVAVSQSADTLALSAHSSSTAVVVAETAADGNETQVETAVGAGMVVVGDGEAEADAHADAELEAAADRTMTHATMHDESLSGSLLDDLLLAELIRVAPSPHLPPSPVPRISMIESLSFTASTPGLCLCVIDDCQGRDLPLLEASITDTRVTHKVNGSGPLDLQGRTAVSLRVSVESYNTALSGWEPLLEPWRVDATRVTRCGRRDWTVHAEHPLEFTLTPVCLASLLATSRRWQTDFEQATALTRRDLFVPYVMHNISGCPLRFWCCIGSQQLPEQRVIDPGQSLVSHAHIYY